MKEDKKDDASSFAKTSEDEVIDLKKKCEEYLDGWKRERASFINYKKEEMERMGEIVKYANEELIFKMLPILDNLALAEKNIPDNLKEDENVKGLLNIRKQIRDFLKCQGVEEINSLNEKFDPNIHEAIEEIESKDIEAGVVIEEVQKGYKLNDKLLRPAKVKIAK